MTAIFSNDGGSADRCVQCLPKASLCDWRDRRQTSKSRADTLYFTIRTLQAALL